MRKITCSRTNCVIYRQLAGVRISELEQRRAAYALRDAEAIVDGMLWVKDRIVSLSTLILRPSFKH